MTILSTEFGLQGLFPGIGNTLLLTSFNLTNGASRLISGYFSDKISRNRIMSMAFLASQALPISSFPGLTVWQRVHSLRQWWDFPSALFFPSPLRWWSTASVSSTLEPYLG